MIRRRGYDVEMFRDMPVRVIRNPQKRVSAISFADLCSVIHRRGLAVSYKAADLCPTVYAVSFKENENPILAIPLEDVSQFLGTVMNNQEAISGLCTEVQKWASALMRGDTYRASTTPQSHAMKEAVLFEFFFEKQIISFKLIDELILVNATQISKAFNKLPVEYLRLNSTIEFRHSLVKRGHSKSFDEQIFTTKGKYGSTWIIKELALEYAKWLSSEFFAWMTDSIQKIMKRNHLPPEQIHESDGRTVACPEPATLGEAQLLIKQLWDKVNRIDVNNTAQRDWFKSTALADELRVSTKQLNHFLAETGIVSYVDGQWTITPEYSHLQIDVPYYWRSQSNKVYTTAKSKRWTPEGREFILRLWHSKHHENQF